VHAGLACLEGGGEVRACKPGIPRVCMRSRPFVELPGRSLGGSPHTPAPSQVVQVHSRVRSVVRSCAWVTTHASAPSQVVQVHSRVRSVVRLCAWGAQSRLQGASRAPGEGAEPPLGKAPMLKSMFTRLWLPAGGQVRLHSCTCRMRAA